MPVTKSEGVKSYIKLRSFKLGWSFQSAKTSPSLFPSSSLPSRLSAIPFQRFEGATLAQCMRATSPASPSSFPVMLSSCTRLQILYVSHPTSTGTWLELASSATHAAPTLDSTLPLLISALAPRNTFVTSPIIRYESAFRRTYVHGIPARERTSSVSLPSRRGLESATITRNDFSSERAASRRRRLITSLFPNTSMTSPSRWIFVPACRDMALPAYSIRSAT
mmetsp:Transcript_13711/g.29791  ORF Transcript_13711/g.29791 Transcript_13711/m.29791 type:complete len:222 (-) Transcript_13711:934-1599(-)